MIRYLRPTAASLVLLVLATPTLAQSATGGVGTRSGPFVLTGKTLSDLLADGYEIRASLGNALILQDKTSVFSCSFATDPEHLSFKSHFVCAELVEKGRL